MTHASPVIGCGVAVGVAGRTVGVGVAAARVAVAVAAAAGVLVGSAAFEPPHAPSTSAATTAAPTYRNLPALMSAISFHRPSLGRKQYCYFGCGYSGQKLSEPSRPFMSRHPPLLSTISTIDLPRSSITITT